MVYVNELYIMHWNQLTVMYELYSYITWTVSSKVTSLKENHLTHLSWYKYWPGAPNPGSTKINDEASLYTHEKKRYSFARQLSILDLSINSQESLGTLI